MRYICNFLLMTVLMIPYGCTNSADNNKSNVSDDDDTASSGAYVFSGDACKGLPSEEALRAMLDVPPGAEYVKPNGAASGFCVVGFKDEAKGQEYALSITIYPEAHSGTALKNELEKKNAVQVKGLGGEAYWTSRQRLKTTSESGLFVFTDTNLIQVIYNHPSSSDESEVRSRIVDLFKEWAKGYK